MNILLKLIPLWFVEVIARCASYIVNLYRPDWAYPAEKHVRGRYWSLVFGTQRLLVGRSVQFEGDNKIVISSQVRIHDGCHIVAGTTGHISIGHNSHLARMTLLSGGGGISIGERCMISSFVAIYSVQNKLEGDQPALNPAEHKEVRIGNDVFIGVGARILPGVVIGDNAVIAAGAVVIRNVESGQIVGGVPAKILN